MNNRLRLLIYLYEEEKAQLQKMIEASLVESEYLMAHYHSQALYQINRRLQTLKAIDDKYIDEEDLMLTRIDNLQRRFAAESSNALDEYNPKDFQQTKEELEKLNQVLKPKTLPEDESFLGETLTKLLDKKIRNLKLILKKVDNLFFSFTYSNRQLKVTLPYVKRHIKRRILNDDNVTTFKKLGFDLTESETKLVLSLTGDKENILNRVKLILARVVFEVFYFQEFVNESYIEFTEKANR